MLRSCALLALLFLLTGCFGVSDFGDYWAQSRLDSALTGRWQKLPDAKSSGAVEQLVFTEQDGAHDVAALVDGKPAEDFDAPYPVKSLTLGKQHYLLSRTRGLGGDMVRYELKGKQLLFYSLQPKALARLPKPPANVKVDEYTVTITRLDAATAQWLTALPDDAKLWQRVAAYRQVP